MDKNMTLEKRIAAELYSYQGKMSVFVDDLHGHTVEIGADEEFETASTIKAYRPAGARPASRKRSPTSRSTSWMARGCCGHWAWARA